MTGILCSLPMIGSPTASPPADPLAVSLNRSTVSGTSTATTITTNSVTATGSGGTSPYTYLWSRVSGNASITATNSNSRTTSFTRTGCVAGTAYAATWKCKVTDAAGDIVYSSNVSITITCEAEEGGGGGDGGVFTGLADQDCSISAIVASLSSTYEIESDGDCLVNGSDFIDAPDIPVQGWNDETTVGGSYEVKATMTSGSLTFGTTGSWLSLSSDRSWGVTDSTQDDIAVTATMTVQIRLVGTTTVLDTATITFSANALS